MTEIEFNVTQPDDAHRVVVTAEEGNTYLVYCEECGRMFREGSGIMEILVKGDLRANHSHSISPTGLDLIIGMSLAVRTETDAKLARLLDDVSIDLDGKKV